jgi:hypothetical protein
MLDKLAIRFAATTRVPEDQIHSAQRLLHRPGMHVDNLMAFWEKLRDITGDPSAEETEYVGDHYYLVHSGPEAEAYRQRKISALGASRDDTLFR